MKISANPSRPRFRLSPWLAAVLGGVLLSGCGGEPETQAQRMPVALERGDECHLCGMLIGTFPGPKGELYTRDSDQVKKFCSTRDMFSFLLDPEYLHQVKEVYVHDMGKSPWDNPADDSFIDARSAWYVLGSTRDGAMGHTLASFGAEADARNFAKRFGGQLYRFEDIRLDML